MVFLTQPPRHQREWKYLGYLSVNQFQSNNVVLPIFLVYKWASQIGFVNFSQM